MRALAAASAVAAAAASSVKVNVAINEPVSIPMGDRPIGFSYEVSCMPLMVGNITAGQVRRRCRMPGSCCRAAARTCNFGVTSRDVLTLREQPARARSPCASPS